MVFVHELRPRDCCLPLILRWPYLLKNINSSYPFQRQAIKERFTKFSKKNIMFTLTQKHRKTLRIRSNNNLRRVKLHCVSKILHRLCFCNTFVSRVHISMVFDSNNLTAESDVCHSDGAIWRMFAR